jgi:hypothetical protein
VSRARAYAVTLGAIAVSTAIGFALQPLAPGAGIPFLLFVPPLWRRSRTSSARR